MSYPFTSGRAPPEPTASQVLHLPLHRPTGGEGLFPMEEI